MNYAADRIRELLKRGPDAGENFFRLKATGNGETHWVNVSPAQLSAIARVLEDDTEDYGGRTIRENAHRAAESVIERAIRNGDKREPNPEWDTASEVYATDVGRCEQYMIAGGGPSEWLCFVFDGDGELDHAYLRYSSTEPALVHFSQYDGELLYKQVKS